MRRYIILILLFVVINLLADFDFARELYEDGLYDEAINEFEMIVKNYPTSYEAERSIFLIAESYRLQNMSLLAEINYKRLLSGYPKNSFKDEIYYSLAMVQFEQSDFQEAKVNLEFISINYPLSEYTKTSLKLYLECFYEMGQYNALIEKGNQIRIDYKNNKNIPAILLLMTRSYLELNTKKEAKELIAHIFAEYPQDNAKWEAIILEAQLLWEEGDRDGVLTKLEVILNETVPRNYEEIYRLMLTNYRIELGNYPEAIRQLNILQDKYNNSDKQDEFLILLTYSHLRSGNYQEVLVAPENPKMIRNSVRYDEYLLYRAEAYLKIGENEKVSELLDEISQISLNDKTIFDSNILEARLLENTGRWLHAVRIYTDLQDSELAKKEDLWLQIGRIYHENLSNYSKAIKYYDLVISGPIDPETQNEAYYLKALCFERMGSYSEAVKTLNNIDLDEIKDDEFRSRIQRKYNYIKKFKQQNYENAFSGLLTSVFNYLDNKDDEELKFRIVEILHSDLKDYQQVNELLKGSSGSKEVYLKALINLDLAEKNFIENNHELAQRYLDRALELAAGLDPSQYKQEIREISLREKILKETEKTEVISNLENFIEEYPDSPALNEFLLMVIDHYREKENDEELVKYISILKNSDKINDTEYYKNKIWLAEYYYRNDEDVKAKRNYEEALPFIDLSHPNLMFHYAVTLDQTGEKPKAGKKLEYLINNSDSFENFDNTIIYYTDHLIELKEFDIAATYFSYIAENARDDDYYLKLSEIYLAVDNKIKAKETIMHVQEKDNETLKKLAMLQYETGDLEMAKYSFSLLKDRDREELNYFEMLGRIAFEQEQYLESAENYKIVVNALGDEPSQQERLNRIALENIIALYRIGNRPKAELLEKRFKSNLSDNDKNIIKLNEGIYYLDINEKKSEKIFSDQLKKSDIDPELRFENYFWRGVSRLKLDKLDEAEADFIVTLESPQQKMKNQANMKLGTLNFSRENYQDALRHYYAVIENDETGKLALDAANNFAYVCKTIEEWQKAVAAYEIILDRWGDETLEGPTLFDIAFCHFRDKRYPDAIEMFNEAILLLNDRELAAEAQYWIGEALFNMADYEKAITEFLKVSYSYDEYVQWSATAELKTGEAYTQDDKPDKARRIYERIISKYGEMSQWGKEAEMRLSLLGN